MDDETIGEDNINMLLMRMTSLGDMDGVRLLVEHGANVNTKDKDGITPLMVAAVTDKLDVARLLLENNADVDA